LYHLTTQTKASKMKFLKTESEIKFNDGCNSLENGRISVNLHSFDYKSFAMDLENV
jgi:hypothetical protein